MKKPVLLLLFLSWAANLFAYEYAGLGYEYLGTVPFGPLVDELLDVRMSWHSLTLALGYAPRSDRLTWEGEGSVQIMVNREFLTMPSFGLGMGAFVGALLPTIVPREASAAEEWRPGLSVSAGAGGTAYLMFAVLMPSLQFAVSPQVAAKLILPTRGTKAIALELLGRLALFLLDPDGFSSQLQAGLLVTFGNISH